MILYKHQIENRLKFDIQIDQKYFYETTYRLGGLLIQNKMMKNDLKLQMYWRFETLVMTTKCEKENISACYYSLVGTRSDQIHYCVHRSHCSLFIPNSYIFQIFGVITNEYMINKINPTRKINCNIQWYFIALKTYEVGVKLPKHHYKDLHKFLGLNVNWEF